MPFRRLMGGIPLIRKIVRHGTICSMTKNAYSHRKTFRTLMFKMYLLAEKVIYHKNICIFVAQIMAKIHFLYYILKKRSVMLDLQSEMWETSNVRKKGMMTRAYSVGWLQFLVLRQFSQPPIEEVVYQCHASLWIKKLYGYWRAQYKKMSQLSKILVTVGVVFLFIIVFGAIADAISDAGQTPGVFGLIALCALIGALRAIWK